MRETHSYYYQAWHRCSASIRRNRYKTCSIAVILLLAFWSVLSGSAWLARKWSAGYSASYSKSTELLEEEIDVLEMEIRERLVNQMWDKYRHNNRFKFSTFWQDAFEAAYEELDSENPTVRTAAVAEIARLSVDFFDMDPVTHKPVQAQKSG